MIEPRNLLPGEEQFERFWSAVQKRNMWQYDYRDDTGHLYSCVDASLDDCIARRRKWQELLRQDQTS